MIEVRANGNTYPYDHRLPLLFGSSPMTIHKANDHYKELSREAA